MNNINKNETINVVAQAFYGNKVATSVKENDVDRLILGYLDDDIEVTEKIDRTIINIPNEDDIVIVYNKYQEEKELNRKEYLIKEKDYELKPLAVVNDFEIYSRCIVCRINENGKLESLKDGDYYKFEKYLAN